MMPGPSENPAAMLSSVAITFVASLAGALALGCSLPNPAPNAEAGAPAPPARVARTLCRGYRDVLAHAMAVAFERVGIVAEVAVRITLVGNHVTQVDQVSGPPAYMPYLRDALMNIQCPGDRGTQVTIVPLIVTFREGR
jgi:hypothetical protein